MSRHFELLKELDKKGFQTPLSSDRGESDVNAFKTLEHKVGLRTSSALSKLVHRVFLGDDNSRCVLFTGAASGVGCSWIAVHTAEALCAETSASVCLADIGGNLHWMGRDFQGSDEAADEPVEDDPLYKSVRRVGRNLWILPATDPATADATPWYQRLEESLIQLRDKFEYVLLDAPQLGSIPPLRAGTLLDGAVVVLKAGHTPRLAVRRAVDDLGSIGIKILGTVLNQRDYPIPASVYKRL
jgi:Mrp family chromosome partitioning ATPase